MDRIKKPTWGKSQDDVEISFISSEDGIYRGENAAGVFTYLNTDVRYRPDDPYFSLNDAIEFGLPRKPRYQIVEGDVACNEFAGTKGYYFNKLSSKWIAFDNSSNECFVEEFKTENSAYDWLNGTFEENNNENIE